jgi:hypothetical protein
MSELTITYEERIEARTIIMHHAVGAMIEYFMATGVDQPTAENQIGEVSIEVSICIYPYILGYTQPLLDAINGSILPFMDQPAKDELINLLTV